MTRMPFAFLIPLLFVAPGLIAQQDSKYIVPRTELGQPSFEGVWSNEFSTPFERPPGIESLIVNPEQAQVLGPLVRSWIPDVRDPDFDLYDANKLALVKGEFRSSIIVHPEDGLMPYTEAATEMAAFVLRRNAEHFDHPEQRPLAERCLESMGYPPIRTAPVKQFRQIVQTRDHVVIHTEDAVGLRIIKLGGTSPTETMRAVEGVSRGYWEGDTLVVETSHFSVKDPARLVVARPFLLSKDSRVTERFTRISAVELFYQFTVEDPTYYNETWRGEMSFTLHDGPLYEYACHEGNYSLPAILRGGQLEMLRNSDVDSDQN